MPLCSLTSVGGTDGGKGATGGTAAQTGRTAAQTGGTAAQLGCMAAKGIAATQQLASVWMFVVTPVQHWPAIQVRPTSSFSVPIQFSQLMPKCTESDSGSADQFSLSQFQFS